jgi:predicted lipoprotein with Yx(FWY)xxD motif
MKRTQIMLAGVLAALAFGVGIADAQDAAAPSASANAPRAHASATTKVVARHTSLGKVLMTSAGFTLYEFTHDRANVDTCAKIHGCLRVWPALQTSGRPLAGRGVKASLLSSIALPGGARQVTYAGHPLYTFARDIRGATLYVGIPEFGGHWNALRPSGRVVK